MPTATRNRILLTLIGVLIASEAICSGLRPSADAHGAVAPFVFNSLVFAHLLATWPLAYSLALLLVRPEEPRRGLAGVSAFIALMFAAASWTSGYELWSALLGREPMTFAVGWFGRAAWSLTLLFPWCAAAWLAFPGPTAATLRDRLTSLATGFLVAFVVPASYANYLFRQETKTLEARVGEGRFVGMLELANQLVAAGSHVPVGEVNVKEFREQLRAQLAAWEASLGDENGRTEGDSQTVQRAALSAALGRYDQARTLLAPLVDREASAALLMAGVLDDQSQHVEAIEHYRQAIALATQDESSVAAQGFIVQAYDGMAASYREQRKPRAAEQAYADGMRAVPAAAAHFEFQLGRHYALGGRPQLALNAFRKAAELDPQNFGFDRPEMQAQLRPLSEAAPTCLLPLP